MAALTRHAFLGSAITRWQPLLSSTKILVTAHRQLKMKKLPQKPKKKTTVDSVMASIGAKGFLRPYKPYQPDSDVSERLDQLCLLEGVSADDMTRIDDLDLRFKLFVKCIEEFEYSIPNSMLCSIETIGDLRKFYQTPVVTTTPLEAMKNVDLPPNLHIQHDYVRFHPDTDKLFNGKSAFPKSGTLVTGLKYKKKYKGYMPERPWNIRVKDLEKDKNKYI